MQAVDITCITKKDTLYKTALIIKTLCISPCMTEEP